jgi:hypothetical protein
MRMEDSDVEEPAQLTRRSNLRTRKN